jgi:hypothetical protein
MAAVAGCGDRRQNILPPVLWEDMSDEARHARHEECTALAAIFEQRRLEPENVVIDAGLYHLRGCRA